ncbi:MAG TPA: endonuclease/exonuclease/phosphatase family protein [Rubrobacter sp.]|nr:endonuclease/exonuclease/phosphatase family protein [Rubrobacter sp.]
MDRGIRLDESSLRVMSFNVRGSFRDPGTKNSWRNRAASNIATIVRYAPDLIGLQEAQRGNLSAYRKHLPHYALIRGPGYGNVIPHDFNAILFDPRRLGLLDSGGFWLSETPERHSRSWETRVARSATWALFNVPGTELSILHLNTHLDHVSARARREGSKLIISRMVEISDQANQEPAMIVTGDCNSRPGGSTYGIFMDAGFADTYLTAGNREGENTFHAFRGVRYRSAHPGRGPRRIDWILLKDSRERIRVKSHRIIRDAISGLYPSDHYPILAELVADDGQRR